MKGDLPLLAEGDSGGAVYDPADPKNLTIIGVNSRVNAFGAESYVARVDGRNLLETNRWIKSILP
jgi:hypothetical protein